MFGPVTDSGQGVPAGIYTGTFEKVEPAPAKVHEGKELKPGFSFKFLVTEDPSHNGQYVGSTTGRIPSGEKPTLKNGLGKFLSELTGLALAPGVDYDAEIGRCFKQKYTLVVKEGPNGGTRVEMVIPLK